LENAEDLRATLDSAFDAVEASDNAPVVTTPTETASEKADRVRDESGRFAKQSAPEPVVVPPTTPTQPAATAALADAAQAAGTTKAPSSWKPEAQAIWTKIDSGQPVTAAELKTFRDEAARRESDYHKGVQGWKQHATQGQAYEQALAPYQETLKTLGVDGVTAVAELMKADHVLRHAPESVKMQKLLELASVYRIDLSKQFSPEIARYEQELFATKEQLKSLETQTQASANASLHSDIDRFASTPGHELFEQVREHMAALLSGGLAKDLDDAYSQAVFANPQTRTTLLEQQQRKAADDQRRQRALSASGSVRGSSPATGSTGAAVNSVRDAVAAAFDAHS
jgi:hypothetical protein